MREHLVELVRWLKSWVVGGAIALSGQMASVLSVGALERSPSEWWMTAMFGLMVPFGLIAFGVGVLVVMGRMTVKKEEA